jgi:hypothetical protein
MSHRLFGEFPRQLVQVYNHPVLPTYSIQFGRFLLDDKALYLILPAIAAVVTFAADGILANIVSTQLPI